MREGAHEPEPIDKRRTIHREGINQVGEILPLHGADVLQPSDGVVSNTESLFLDSYEPARESREIERRLFPSVHQYHGTRHPELGAATLCQNRDWRGQYWRCGHLPFERRGNPEYVSAFGVSAQMNGQGDLLWRHAVLIAFGSPKQEC